MFYDIIFPVSNHCDIFNPQSWSYCITDHQLDQNFSSTHEGGRFSGGQLFPEVCQIFLENSCTAGGMNVSHTEHCPLELSHTLSISRTKAYAPVQMNFWIPDNTCSVYRQE